MVPLALRVEERPGRPVRPEGPPEHPDVLGVRARTEDGEKLAVDAAQAQEAGVAEVAVEGPEFAPEAVVVEEGGAGLRGVVGVAVHRTLYEEYVVDPGLTPGPRPPLEAEDQLPADGDEVAGDGGVLGAHLLGGQQPQLGGAELLGPPGVERLGPPHELPGLRGEPPPQHLIGTGIHIAFPALPALRRGGGGGGGDVAVHAYGSPYVFINFSPSGV